MADIPMRRRQGTPSWVYLIVGLIVLLIFLALIDYFVTNLVLNRGPAGGPAPAPADDPFSALVSTVTLLSTGAVLSLTHRL